MRILLSGCNGHMGQSIVELCAGIDDAEIVAGMNRTAKMLNAFPVFASPAEFTGEADVIIDFSNPANLSALLAYSAERRTPIVLCTTGYSEAQLEEISAAAEKTPVFRSGNMSLGINLMLELVRRAAAVLGDGFDVEIIEKHHNRKVDAPSGTALMLADAAAGALPYPAEYVYSRHEERRKRGKNEIGVYSVRGGTIVGEHTVLFAGQDEVLEIKHTAQSREVFASGAIAAARFMANITRPGMYDMRDAMEYILAK